MPRVLAECRYAGYNRHSYHSTLTGNKKPGCVCKCDHSRCGHKLSLLQLSCLRLDLTLHEPWRHDRGKTISMSGPMICKQLSSQARRSLKVPRKTFASKLMAETVTPPFKSIWRFKSCTF